MKKNYKVAFTGMLIIITGGMFAGKFITDYSLSKNDHLDLQISNAMKEYLDRANYCDEIMRKNKISDKELKLLLKIKKHDTLTFRSIKELEQELLCQAIEVSNLLYLDWLINKSEKDYKVIARTNFSSFSSSFLQSSISLTAENKKHIPEDSIKILENIEFFKQPFRLESSLLEQKEKD